MDIRFKIAVICVGAVLLVCGCAEPGRRAEEIEKVLTAPTTAKLGTTIGDLIEVFSTDTIPVEGYSLVGELAGTGSSQCPPKLRQYLKQYIQKQVAGDKTDADSLINSMDTAVVIVQGHMPTAASRNQYFDLRVRALEQTQTRSLAGGWLYGADLRASFGLGAKVLAKGQGGIFMDILEGEVENPRSGYILAGGRVLDEYMVKLTLRRPDFQTGALIRDRINGRFFDNPAMAISDSVLKLEIPAGYKDDKDRFLAVVKAMYMRETPKLIQQRITSFIRKLAGQKDQRYASEIALEAIGNKSLPKLSILLKFSDEEIRFRAARCMLRLGSDDGLDTLREIARDNSSVYRIEALEAIATAGTRKDASAISRRLLRDSEFKIRLAAYEQLQKLQDSIITQKLIARSFYLDKVAQDSGKAVYVYRSGVPRIVLFGSPIYCRKDAFVKSRDGTITINAIADAKEVVLIREIPGKSPIRLKSSLELGDIIETLCGEPAPKKNKERRGLGVPYYQVIAILRQMSEKGAIQAQFHAGPLPEISLKK
ncbi:flagellar basal body P-ring protein FlgI [Planctomycetota bacterium]